MNTSFISRFPPLVKNFGLGMFFLGATLALGVVLSSQAVGTAVGNYSKGRLTINVKGVAEVLLVSDMGHWSGTISASGSNMAESISKLDVSMNKVQTLIKANQFQAGEINLSGLNVTPVYIKNEKGYTLNKIDYYVASQTASVSSPRVDAVRDLQRKTSDLIREGVQIVSDHPTYTCSTIENVKMNLLAKATQNGYERAQVLAKSSGSTVGTLANASQGVFQIVSYGSTDVSDYGISDTSSIKKNAKAVVSMEYFIEK
ncbi:MAG: SIMPL domain-containing protein [Phycisphaerales bacterium]|nr:SIMPL domain-containing protein [Phycisphaerales bacterium]